ncbi:protein phosphatase 1L [Monodelphis domestica]|uniref:protein phosphatase 1L n=1 Tax=Monodelphis domestica TaxID=13616 RepID=UPI0024E2093A|nr:protein phosphatase 1L [Monodelphis domestica]XP_056663065.1 protein phosphatase 1L [Monodelphis domestica]
MIEDTMTLLSLLGRIMRYFLLRPETLFLLCISLALWSYFFHTDEVKTIVKSSRDAVKMVKGKVAEIMQNDRLGGLDVLEAEFSKTWEFKSHNVAVYSIQGRRDHMEDRFEVLTDLVNKTHPSIFGIFDGHGGESAAEYVKSRLPEALKQHLQDYEKDKENSVLSYQAILEQQILSIDREMLEKLTVSYDEAGMSGGFLPGRSSVHVEKENEGQRQGSEERIDEELFILEVERKARRSFPKRVMKYQALKGGGGGYFCHWRGLVFRLLLFLLSS